MPAEVRISTDGAQYELGAEIEGAWVPFITRPTSDVAGILAATEAARAAAGGATGATGAAATGAAAAGATGAAAAGTGAPSNAELQAEIDALRAQVADLGGEPAPAPPAPPETQTTAPTGP